MIDAGTTLARALHLHQQGELDGAELLYFAVLGDHPEHPDALHLYGFLAFQKGNAAAARERIERAIAIKPGVAMFHNNLGLVLSAQGLKVEAIERFRRAAEIDPRYVDAWTNLGGHLVDIGRARQAIDPLNRAVQLSPDDASAQCNLGSALHLLGESQAAVDCFERAILLRPDFSEAMMNLGTALTAVGRASEAVAPLRRLLNLNPAAPGVRRALASALHFCGEYDDVLVLIDEDLQRTTDDAELHVSRGASLLLNGDFESGLDEYEFRTRLPELVANRAGIDAPDWTGEPLDGKRIVVSAEQGLGDNLQFARYLPLLHRRGAEVVFRGPALLERIIRSVEGVREVVRADAPISAPTFMCIT